MVRTLVLAALAALAAGSAAAEPHWRHAGGDLFVGRAQPPSEISDLAPPKLSPLRQPFTQEVAEAAAQHGLDPKLLHALVAVESAYRPTAQSPVGAAGLTQLMPDTARDLGVSDPFDPAANLQGGADYLARQLVRFGDIRLALAAYNAGPARVAALGRIPAIAETQAYVRSVVECFLALSAGREIRASRDCPAPMVSP